MDAENIPLTVTCPSCGSSLTLNHTAAGWQQQLDACVMPYCGECHHLWPLSEEAKEQLKQELAAKVS